MVLTLWVPRLGRNSLKGGEAFNIYYQRRIVLDGNIYPWIAFRLDTTQRVVMFNILVKVILLQDLPYFIWWWRSSISNYWWILINVIMLRPFAIHGGMQWCNSLLWQELGLQSCFAYLHGEHWAHEAVFLACVVTYGKDTTIKCLCINFLKLYQTFQLWLKLKRD